MARVITAQDGKVLTEFYCKHDDCSLFMGSNGQKRRMLFKATENWLAPGETWMGKCPTCGQFTIFTKKVDKPIDSKPFHLGEFLQDLKKPNAHPV